jgi:biopolymer transport protein ExbD
MKNLHIYLKRFCIRAFIRSLFVGTAFIAFASIGLCQGLTVIDSRSLRGKIDPKNNQPIIVEVGSEGSYKLDSKRLLSDELSRHLDAIMDTRMPGERRVFIASEGETPFKRIADLMLLGRRLEIDDYLFTEHSSATTAAAPVKIVLEEPEATRPTPGAGFLGIDLLESGQFSLNGKPKNDAGLVAALKAAFDRRRRNRVYIEGERRVDKTVFVRAKALTKYADLLRVLRLVQSTGAYPIAVEIDWLS